jgi:acyl carrier protein
MIDAEFGTNTRDAAFGVRRAVRVRITPDARLGEDLEIDSIDAVDLIERVRRVIGRKVTPEDFRSVRTVGDLVQAIERLANG